MACGHLRAATDLVLSSEASRGTAGEAQWARSPRPGVVRTVFFLFGLNSRKGFERLNYWGCVNDVVSSTAHRPPAHRAK